MVVDSSMEDAKRIVDFVGQGSWTVHRYLNPSCIEMSDRMHLACGDALSIDKQFEIYIYPEKSQQGHRKFVRKDYSLQDLFTIVSSFEGVSAADIKAVIEQGQKKLAVPFHMPGTVRVFKYIFFHECMQLDCADATSFATAIYGIYQQNKQYSDKFLYEKYTRYMKDRQRIESLSSKRPEPHISD